MPNHFFFLFVFKSVRALKMCSASTRVCQTEQHSCQLGQVCNHCAVFKALAFQDFMVHLVGIRCPRRECKSFHSIAGAVQAPSQSVHLWVAGKSCTSFQGLQQTSSTAVRPFGWSYVKTETMQTDVSPLHRLVSAS